ncbi:MAG: PD-(D/E)XK nuclease family transposase, partial [Sulfuricurvum sp.]
ELPKFTKDLESLATLLDKWIYFIKNAPDLVVIPEQYSSIQEFTEAFTIATQTTWDTKELEVYDYISLKEFDELNALRTAEKKGMEKGMEKGEQHAKIQIAKTLISQNFDTKAIALITGLSTEAIEDLKEEEE